jgi:hypothetical protein
VLDRARKNKNHFRAKIFREKTSHSEAEKKQRKHQAPAMFRYQRVDGWIQMTERY